MIGRLVFFFILLSQSFFGHTSDDKSLIKFTENKKQWDNSILFRAQLDGGALFLQNNKLVYHLYDKDLLRSLHIGKKQNIKNSFIRSQAFSVTFINSEKTPTVFSSHPTPDYNNYFLGNDKSHWASNVKNYTEVVYQGIYPGVKLEILGKSNSLKYNFYVQPGNDPSGIKMQYDGLTSISIKKGELVLETIFNELTEHKPYAYQIIEGATVNVPCKFVLKNNTVSFEFPKGYNKNYELVIDPTLVFAASSGSTADNFGMTATYDSLGNLYSGGTVFNIGFPTTLGVYDPTYNGIVQAGRTDVVITKYDANGAFLQYSTYIGGSLGSEIVTSIIVDKQNNLFLYGATGSTDFPTTAGCYDNTFNGGKYMSFVANGTKFELGTDIYVAKLNATATTLLGSTYIGGSQNDGVNHNNDTVFITSWAVWEYPLDSLQFNYGDQYRGEITLDKFDEVYIASSSRSSDFPMINGFDNTLGGTQDAIAFKFNSSLTNLVWSNFIGGTDKDAGYALFVDDSLNTFVTGGTASSNFPTLPGAYQATYNGGKCDGYVVKIGPTGATLKQGSYVGTTSYDQSYFVQQNTAGEIFLYGQSTGAMSITAGVYSNANSGQFVKKLSNNLNTQLASTRFGNGNGQTNISPSAFLIDCSGNIYLSGWGGNIITQVATLNMPITTGAIQSTTDGFNFYLMVLGPNMTSLRYATYFGGANSWEHVDGGTSRFDKQGIIYQSVCAGCGGNDDFPVTPGAWPTSQVGTNVNQSFNCNNGTFKIDFQLIGGTANFTTNTTNGCAPLTINFTNIGTPGFPYLWDFGGNDTTSTVFNPIHTFTTPGTYTVNLYVMSNSCYNLYDTAQQIIVVKPTPVANFNATVSPCSNNATFVDSSFALVNSWNWNFGSGQLPTSSTSQNPGAVNYPGGAGTYTTSLIVTNTDGCKDTIIKTQTILLSAPTINTVPIQCSYDVAQLQITGGTSYTWTPSAGLNNSFISNPLASPDSTTAYSVNVLSINTNGDSCFTTLTTTVSVHPIINADFDFSINPCGNTVAFFDSSMIAPTGWAWNFGDGQTALVQNPSHAYSTPGTYTVSLITNNSNGCVDTTFKPITLGGFSPSGLNGGGTICPGDSVMLVAYGGVAYSWSPALGLSSTTNDTVYAAPDSSTTYSVIITTINSSGDTCLSTYNSSVNVSVLTAAQAYVTADNDTIILGGSTTIHGIVSIPNFTYTWSPTNTLNNPFTLNPVASPQQTTTYNLFVTDAAGCTYILPSVTIYVIANKCDEGTVFLPNTFTPNDDKVNDVLYIRSNFITEVYLAIYNRWGELVFETNDIKKGWDGMYKGMKCDPGVFGYYMKVLCNNGDESFKKGNITIIR